MSLKFWRPSLIFVLLAAFAAAQTAEQKTARYLDSIRRQPSLLLAFLRDMPKGGDLHNHLDGAIYAEDLLDFAASDNFCVDRTTSKLMGAPCDSCEHYTPKPSVRCAYDDHILYNQIIDAWSMRNWRPGDESGHDHFFATFDKFGLASHNHVAEAVATVINRAAREHVQYIEFMHTADGRAAAQLGTKLGWNDNNDFGKMREQLLAGGLKEIAAATSKTLAEDDARAQKELKCGTPDAEPGCSVQVRYLYQVLRGLPHEAVFAQIVLGFELASSDPHFVGLNLVMPEDWYVPIHDFNEHMAMLDYLHGVYPKVHISLHAGEIAMGLVKPEDLALSHSRLGRARPRRAHRPRRRRDARKRSHRPDERNGRAQRAGRNQLDLERSDSRRQRRRPSAADLHEVRRPGCDFERRRRRSPLRHDARISARRRGLPPAVHRVKAHDAPKHRAQLPAGRKPVGGNEVGIRSGQSMHRGRRRRGEAVSHMREISCRERARPRTMEAGGRVRKVRKEILIAT